MIVSGTNSGVPEISEECITSTVDAEPEVSSKREQDGEATFYLESTDSDLEEIVEERGSNLRTRSSVKRERRKTLQEYFLDSPPELAAENAFQVPPVDLVQLRLPASTLFCCLHVMHCSLVLKDC